MEIERTLSEVGHGLFAYTQLPGSWGFSNAGLVTDGDQALLIDTLFDRRSTARMLKAMRDAAPAAAEIGMVVNTHGDGDHCYGNGELPGAEIVGTAGCRDDLRSGPPKRNAMLLTLCRALVGLGGAGRVLARGLGAIGLRRAANLFDAAPFALENFDCFEFRGNDLVLPTRVFEGQLELRVGDRRIEVIEIGAAHTAGDAVVYVPDDRVLFSGDLLFKDAHPVVWKGPVSNWIAACDRLLELDVDVVVPGHGPVTDPTGLRETKHYLEVLTEEARSRFEAGMTVEEAANDIVLDEFGHWLDAERIFINVNTLYRDFGGKRTASHVIDLIAGAARLRRRRAPGMTTAHP